MKTMSTLLGVLLCLHSFSQITVDGNSSNLQVSNNEPSVLVDPSLTVQTTHTIPAFRVSISSNFNSGDVLSYDAAAKPAGISALYSSGTLTFSGNGTAAEYQALLRTVTFATTSTNALSRAITFEAGNGTLKHYNGHFYRHVSNSVSWTTAKANAESESFFGWQGYLVTITSNGENDFIWNSVGKGWIGASDAATEDASENNWHWVTGPEKGTKFSTGSSVVSGQYAAWTGGEPNNSGGLEHYAENAYPNNGRWNDAQNNNNSNYIVEFGHLPAGINVDIFHSRNVTMIATQVTTTVPPVAYDLQAPAIAVDPDLVIYSASNFTEGKATISGNFRTGDVLSFTGSLPGEFSGSYNSTTGVLSFSTTGTVTASQWQDLFRSVEFYSSSTIIGNRVVTFSLGNQVAGSNGHFYEYVPATANWPTAKTNASNRTYLGLKGYLTTITSQEENDFIKQKLSADAWIGASDDHRYINEATGVSTYGNQSDAEGKWYWVTGPEKGMQITTANAPGGGYPPAYMGRFNNWNAGEPNNYWDGSQNEHVAEVYSTGGINPGRWNDNRENQAKGYVVEYGGLAVDPLLFLSANRTISILAVLPVTSLSLTAENSSQGVQLRWTTATEVNTASFNVQHSTDGARFTTIARVAAAGNSNVQRSYEALHATPARGANYYRLQQVDRDGKMVYSQVAVVYGKAAKLQVLPNPATSAVTITYPAGNAALLTVYGVRGEVLLSRQMSDSQTVIDVSAFTPGVYIVEMKDGAHRESLRFIKQ